MTDRPEHAKWLKPEEREWLTSTMNKELADKQKSGNHSFLAGLKDPRTIAYSALYFGLVCGIYGLGLWMPTIVKALGKFDSTQVGFIVFIPYAIAAVFVYFWSKRSTAPATAYGTPALHGDGRRRTAWRRLPAPRQCRSRHDLPDHRGHGYLLRDRALPGDAIRSPDRRCCCRGPGHGELPRQPRRLRGPYVVGLLKDDRQQPSDSPSSQPAWRSPALPPTSTRASARKVSPLPPPQSPLPPPPLSPKPDRKPFMTEQTTFPTERTVVLTGAASAAASARHG